MAITGEALGGSMLVTGWTTQNAGVAVGALSPDEEQGFGANSLIINAAAQFNYVGWSMITEDSIAAPAHPGTLIPWVTRIFVPVGAVTSKVDFIFTGGGTVTHWFVGLYNTAGTQVAVTVDSFASIATGLITLNWVAPATLTGGSFYYVVSNMQNTGNPTLAGCTGASAAALNAGLTTAAPEAATWTSTAGGAVPATLTFGGTMTLFASEPFVGLH
jgi:hypothetical protein